MQINSSVSFFLYPNVKVLFSHCWNYSGFLFFVLIFGEGMHLYGVETLLFDTLMTRDSQ